MTKQPHLVKNPMNKYFLRLALVSLLLMSCSTRQITEKFAGSTEQRLTAHSIHNIMSRLPEKDFSLLKDKTVFVECFFLEDSALLAYARHRLKMALREKFQCRFTDASTAADYHLTVFFTSLGTDFDKTGISTPDIVLPGLGGFMGIDIITLEKYQGITELYYYLQDASGRVIVKSAPLKQVVRNDSLALPVITIPINTVD